MLDDMHIKPYDVWGNSAPSVTTAHTSPIENNVPIQAASPAASQQSQEEQPSCDTPDESARIIIETPTETTQTARSDDPIATILAELKELKVDIIDDRHQSETLYVIGGKELEQTLYAYRAQGIAFSRMLNGNQATAFTPAWYAKIQH